MNKIKFVIASDHAGYLLKEEIKEYYRKLSLLTAAQKMKQILSIILILHISFVRKYNPERRNEEFLYAARESV